MLKDVWRYGLGRGLPAVLNLVSILVYSQLLSPSAYGVYGIAVAASTTVNAVAFQWLRVGLLRFFDNGSHSNKTLVATITSLHLFLAIPASLIVVGVVWAVVPSTTVVVLVMSAGLLASQALFDLTNELNRVRLHAGRYAALAVGRAFVATALGLWLATRGAGAIAPMAGLIAGNLAFSTIGLRMSSASQSYLGEKILDRDWLKRLGSYGVPLAFAFALSTLLSTSDRIMIGWLRGVSETGLYTIGADLAQNSVGMLMFVVNLAAYPLILAALREGGMEKAASAIRFSGTLLLAIAVPTVVGIVMVRNDIATYLIGEEFRTTASQIMPWIAASAAFSGIKAFHYDLAFQLAKRTHHQVWISLAAVLINIVLNLALIPSSGAIGAAIATLASNFFALVASAHFGRLLLRIPGIPLATSSGLTILIATLALTVVVLVTTEFPGPSGLAFQVAAAVATYLGCLWALDFLGLRKGLRG